MVCLRWTEIVLACSAAEDFVSTEHNAGECKIHDIVSLFVSAFTAAWNICDSAGEGNRLTLGAKYISVPVSSSDSHCLTTIYQMHSIRHL